MHGNQFSLERGAGVLVELRWVVSPNVPGSGKGKGGRCAVKFVWRPTSAAWNLALSSIKELRALFSQVHANLLQDTVRSTG
eukprot:1156227-Pelagomonas_calceolata.AAC.5